MQRVYSLPLLFGLAECFDHCAVKSIGALGGARDVIDFRALPLGDLRRQPIDDGTGVARAALRYGGGSDAAAFDDDLGFDIAVARIAPAGVRAVFPLGD